MRQKYIWSMVGEVGTQTHLRTRLSCRSITTTCCAVITALTLITPCYAQSSPPVRRLTSRATLARKIDNIVEAGRRELRLPSVSIAIMRGHKLVLAKGYGLADRATGTPARAHTIYAIGSISKQFTAAAIMKLYEEGRLQLDEPVTKYLHDYRAAQTPVPTIRNLLVQNSGLPEWNKLPDMQNIDTGDASRFELPKMVELISRQPQLYRPGDWWSYSNSNYTVLAAVVQQVSGTAHDEYLARTFFEPLRLKSTGGCASARMATGDRRAVGYQDNNSYAPSPDHNEGESLHRTGWALLECDGSRGVDAGPCRREGCVQQLVRADDNASSGSCWIRPTVRLRAFHASAGRAASNMAHRRCGRIYSSIGVLS